MTIITAELLRRYDVPGPRYTSYPTADRFSPDFTPQDYIAALHRRRDTAADQPLSLYLHIPFCESLCYYCGCNKIITRHHERAAAYLQALEREADLHVAHCGSGQTVSQLHFGGGTPTFLLDEELAALMDMLRRRFTLVPEGEYSIEVDPRTVTPERLAVLQQLGFNRLSFGVQDFDSDVQKAVHREQSTQQVADLLQAARSMGFKSLNMDLIYGLPKQTPASFARTLEQVCELRPDRIALYAYAHLPERFKSQRRILYVDLPLPEAKVGMLAAAMQTFTQAGYVYIGMDHFALPDDALAVALAEGRLHRNFQGYSTQPDCDLIALGVSAIGRVGNTYSQNAKTLEEYYAAVDAGQLPIVRGLTLSHDDELRRAVIMAIMCQGELVFADIQAQWGVNVPDYFAPELRQLQSQAEEGLVQLQADRVRVTPKGWLFVRGVALVFDRYLQAARNETKFSRII